MVTVTETAIEYLIAMADANEHPEGTVLRLEPSGQQLAFTFGPPEPGDDVIQKDGQDVLHISEVLIEPLDGAIMDTVETPEGIKLTLTR